MTERQQIEHALATRMSPIARGWQRLADAALASLGISNSSGWTLVHLERLGPETRQRELARAIGVSEASLVRTLHQLERAGLVVRRTDPEDRRTNRLALTEAGAALAARIDARLIALRHELLDGIAEEEIATAVRLLDTVAYRIAERRP